MSDEAAAIDLADPLGRRRCAKCLYDRLGLPAASACPECGFILPSDVTVLNLPRAPESAWTVAVPVVMAGVLFGLLVQDPVGTLGSLDLPVVLLACGLLTAVLRWWRLHLSDDAYVAQVWLTDRGIGVEQDVDRFGIARSVERVAVTVLTLAPLAVVIWPMRRLLLAGSVWSAVACGAVGLMVAALLAPWFRGLHLRAAKPDAIAPAILPWSKVLCAQADTHWGCVASITLKSTGFVQVRRVIRFAGGPADAHAVQAVIDKARYPRPAAG